MSLRTLFIILILSWVKNSFAVQCNTNPCQLNGDFSPPNYQCFQLQNSFNDVICTCPNGQGRQNIPCRICDNINCGPNGICIERSFFPGVFYACGCTNGTYTYINTEPCPGAVPTTTTTAAPTLPPIICLNGGVYSIATASCVCRTGFTGHQCETSIGQELCRSITCVNGGVCNPVPTANNGVEAQCWCLNGFSGPNCELIGTPRRCIPNFCLNNGVCEERRLGSSLYAYCQCPPGFNGQYCETSYFSCSNSGLFTDWFNCKFGRYFQCIDRVAVIRSCQQGFRFNQANMQCESNVSCPS